MWDNDYKMIFIANSYQENQIFIAELFNTSKPIINKYEVKYSGMSYSQPYIAVKNTTAIVTKIVAYDSPERLLLLKYNDEKEQIDIFNLNDDFIKTKFISKAEPFNFTGANNEEVWEFFYKPMDYSPDKIYIFI